MEIKDSRDTETLEEIITQHVQASAGVTITSDG